MNFLELLTSYESEENNINYMGEESIHFPSLA